MREWLKDLPEAERRASGKDLLRAQWRWPVGMPLCRPSLGSGLWEIRTDLPTIRTERQGLALSSPWAPRGCSGWLYQEGSRNSAGRGLGMSPQASEGVVAMSKKHMGSEHR